MAVSSLKNKSKLSTLTSPFDIDLGGMIPLATVAVTSSTATVSFSSIPDYYEHLQVRVLARSTGGNIQSYIKLEANSDTTGTNYYSHYIQADGSTVVSGPNANASIHYDIAGNNANASVFGAVILDILDYSNSNKYKTIKALGGTDNNGSGRMNLTSGLWMNTNKISSLTFTPFSGSFAQHSLFALYGIKRAGA